MRTEGNVVLRDLVEIKVIKIGWRRVTLRITIGDNPYVDRTFSKNSIYKGHVHLELKS